MIKVCCVIKITCGLKVAYHDNKSQFSAAVSAICVQVVPSDYLYSCVLIMFFLFFSFSTERQCFDSSTTWFVMLIDQESRYHRQLWQPLHDQQTVSWINVVVYHKILYLLLIFLPEVNDLSEERGENDVDYRTVAYNPNKTLSIDHQRTRLPIFNVSEVLFLFRLV